MSAKFTGSRLRIVVLAFALSAVLAMLVWLVSNRAQHGAVETPPAVPGSTAPPAGETTAVLTRSDPASRAVVGERLLHTVSVDDADPISDVAAYEPTVRALAYRTADLKLLGKTENGWLKLACDQHPQPQNEPDQMVLCTHKDYLPVLVKVPRQPGTYSVTLRRGRTLTAKILAVGGQPIVGARVIFYSKNLDRSLLATRPADEQLSPLISPVGPSESEWFAEAVSDEKGEATTLAPARRVLAFPIAEGRFLASFPAVFDVDEGQVQPAEARVMTMEEFWVGVVDCPESTILGRTLPAHGIKWRTAGNVFASSALDEVTARLRQEHPGALTICKALVLDERFRRRGVSSNASVDEAPEVSFMVLQETGVFGKIRCRLRRYSQRGNLAKTVCTLDMASQYGTLQVGKVDGYPTTRTAPLYCIIKAPNSQDMGVPMWYGGSYKLPVGAHSVFMLQLGMRERTLLTDVTIEAGRLTSLAAPELVKVRWPVTVSVRYPDGSSPSFCTLDVKGTNAPGDLRPMTFGTVDCGEYEIFLFPGTYELALRSAASVRCTQQVVVGSREARVVLTVPWHRLE